MFFGICAVQMLTSFNAGKAREGSRKADFSPEVASKSVRSPSDHFAEVRGENSRNGSTEL